MTRQTAVPLPKIKAILLYLANNTNSKYLGKVKLMKLFYFADFLHVKKYGTPITFDSYVNLEHGPIPSAIKNLIDSAADDIESSVLQDTISFERPEGTKMFRVIPTRAFIESDAKLLSDTELDILRKVCLRFSEKTTQFVEDESHNEAPWKNTRLLDNIPYELAAQDPDSQFSEDELKLLSLV